MISGDEEKFAYEDIDGSSKVTVWGYSSYSAIGESLLLCH